MSNFIQHIIIDNTLKRIGETAFADYLCHAYCYGGHCTFERNGQSFRFEAGDCLQRFGLPATRHSTSADCCVIAASRLLTSAICSASRHSPISAGMYRQT